MNKSLFLFCLCCTEMLVPAVAAPLDAFLSADHATSTGNGNGNGYVEGAYDLVNGSVDVFNIRNNDANYAGTNVGDYHGAHVRAGVAISPTLWFDGAFWNRRLAYREDVIKISSWQLAAQYKLIDGAGYQPAVALRLGAWGNYASELKKTSNSTVRGQTLNSVTVDSPKDQQYQLDLIATSTIFERTALSMFAGAGVGRVNVGSVSATASLGGCLYNLAFGVSEIVATQAGSCGNVVDSRGTLPNSTYGVDVYGETQYHASFVHGGFNLNWHGVNWQAKGGYQYQYLRRNRIDDTIASRGATSYQSNHMLLVELRYKVMSQASIFVRGQYMTNQFVGEIPFAYNTLTASRFGNRYGILSTGLIVSF